jgi:thioredoxin reductase (NADPH)
MKKEDVTIIGAGPAGVTAAMQLKRSGIQPVIVEKQKVGGIVNNAHWIENYPGFPGGITGVQLASLLARHLDGAGLDVLFEEVIRLDHDGRHFLVETTARRWLSGIVILSTGTKPRPLPGLMIPREAEQHIFYEIVPIRDCSGRKIAIVGAGDAAFDYALNLSKNNDVTILNRSKEARCLPLLRKRANESRRITVQDRATIQAITNVSPEGFYLEVLLHEKQASCHVNHLVIAIGREPQRDFLSEAIIMRSEELKMGEVLYEIGDVRNGSFRQVSIAVGDGMRAAMSILERLKRSRS